jgi:hypothetical protein
MTIDALKKVILEESKNPIKTASKNRGVLQGLNYGLMLCPECGKKNLSWAVISDGKIFAKCHSLGCVPKVEILAN